MSGAQGGEAAAGPLLVELWLEGSCLAPLAVVCPVAEGGLGPALRALPSRPGGDGDFSTHSLSWKWHDPPGPPVKGPLSFIRRLLSTYCEQHLVLGYSGERGTSFVPWGGCVVGMRGLGFTLEEALRPLDGASLAEGLLVFLSVSLARTLGAEACPGGLSGPPCSQGWWMRQS